MLDWLLKKPAARNLMWNVAASPDHTYVVFGDARLAAQVAGALTDLDRTLAEASREARADIDDPAFVDQFDDDGNVRTIIAERITIEPVADVERARAATIDPSAFADATSALCVRAKDTELLEELAPYALLGAACAIARAADGRVYDTLGMRIVPQELVDDTFSGLPLHSVGAHVTIVNTTDADGTLRFTTVGLAKFGLFDVTLGSVPASQPEAADIVAAFAQSRVPDSPRTPGPWKVDQVYVSASDISFFYDGPDAESSAKKPTYVRLQARPIASESRIWAIEGEKGPLGASGIAKALEAFARDRATAKIEAAETAAKAASAQAEATNVR
jgi:hypothetical protein